MSFRAERGICLRHRDRGAIQSRDRRRDEESTPVESADPDQGRSFASFRACPELEGITRIDGGRSFAVLRMTGRKSEGMTGLIPLLSSPWARPRLMGSGELSRRIS